MSFFEFCLDLLFPPKCPFCGRLLEKDELLCPDCQRDLPWLHGIAAEKKVELTKGCVSVLRYQDKVRKAIHGYKFSGLSARSGVFGVRPSLGSSERPIAGPTCWGHIPPWGRKIFRGRRSSSLTMC